MVFEARKLSDACQTTLRVLVSSASLAPGAFLLVNTTIKSLSITYPRRDIVNALFELLVAHTMVSDSSFHLTWKAMRPSLEAEALLV